MICEHDTQTRTHIREDGVGKSKGVVLLSHAKLLEEEGDEEKEDIIIIFLSVFRVISISWQLRLPQPWSWPSSRGRLGNGPRCGPHGGVGKRPSRPRGGQSG
jgi:hypothetical protein